MKRSLIVAALLLFCAATSAQNANGLVMRTLDSEQDSIAFAEIRDYMAKIRKTRPTVAVVLSGGGAKGAAHIGVLKYIEEMGIPVDMVLGTSMGGLMGGLYAMGYTASAIDSILRSIDWGVMMSDMIPPDRTTYTLRKYRQTYALRIPFHYEEGVWEHRSQWGNKSDVQKLDASLPDGYLYGLNVYNMLGSLSVGYQDSIRFLDLPIPFCCVAGDVVSMKQKNWTGGSLIDAMRSTMSIPVYFKPIRRKDRVYVDGGIRDNFPIDIALQTGADIIIGVDLSQKTDYDNIHNIFTILMQSMTSLGDEAFVANMDKASVYIHPDITGYNMLSFGKKEIADIIDKGYKGAAEHRAELEEVVKLTGVCGHHLNNRPAVDINTTQVLVNNVLFEGLNEEEQKFFYSKLNASQASYVNKKMLDDAVFFLYGTNRFNSVTYRLLGDKEPYSVLFICEKKPIHEVGIGLRGDTDQAIEMSAHIGINHNTIWGNKLDIKAVLSMSPKLTLHYSYVPKKGPGINVSLSTSYEQWKGRDILYPVPTFGADIDSRSDRKYVQNYREYAWNNDLRAFLDFSQGIYGNFNVGLSLKNMPYYYALSDDTATPTLHNWESYCLTAFILGELDTRDDIYFPNRGVRLAGSLDYLIKGFANYYPITNPNVHDTYYISASVESAISIGSRFAFIPTLHGRAILGETNQFPFMRNFVDGVVAGRHYDHQIPFFGMNRNLFCTDTKGITAVGRLDARCRVWKKAYVSAVASYLMDYNMDNPYSVDNNNTFNSIWAFGAEVSYDSAIGPVRLDIHWDNKTTSLGAYFGVGFDF